MKSYFFRRRFPCPKTLMLTTTIEPVQLITIEPAQLPAIEPVLPVENKNLAYWRWSACKLWTLASLAIVAVGGAVTSQPTFGQPPTIGRMTRVSGACVSAATSAPAVKLAFSF